MPPLNPAIEISEKTTPYQGFFRLEKYRLRHTLFGGGWSRWLIRERLARGRAAGVLLYDPALDAVVILEQFRIGAVHDGEPPERAWMLEVVAGLVEEGETPEDVARREAVEEAACVAGAMEFICEYHVSPGGDSERITLFCGRVDASQAGGVHGLPAEGEDILARVYPVSQAFAMLQAGEFRSAMPIIALQWLQLHHRELRQRWLNLPA